MPTDTSAPLILTLTLNEAAQHHYTQLRQQYFPPERNYLAAHVTLFHHLPGVHLAAIQQQLAELATSTPRLQVQVAEVRFLGGGVAYSLENQQLRQLHRELQHLWSGWLTPQDKQPLRPHITVQNKVPAATARALYTQLQDQFIPSVIEGIGFTLWEYQGGPWRELAHFPFRNSAG